MRRPILLILATVLACGGQRAEPVAPVLVVGMDGLEWNVLRPLLQQGKCPNLRALMERGSWGHLATFTPTLSPIIWTSIGTGKMPADHGIHGFLDSQQRVYTSSRRACKALWNIADDHGLSSNVFGWFTTWPVEPVRGAMVSGSSSSALAEANWKPALARGIPDQVHPADLEPRVLQIAEQAGSLEEIQRLARERIFGPIAKTDLRFAEDKLIQETLWSIQSDATFGAIAADVMRERPADLTLVYFGGTDVVGHRFWRYMEPAKFTAWFEPKVLEWARQYVPDLKDVHELFATPAGEAALAGVIPRYYEWCDEMLGELLSAAGENTTVLVVSDHGMHASSTERPNGEFMTGHHQDGPPGVIVAAGPGIRRQGGLESFLANGELSSHGTVLGVAPTVLALLGIPAAEDMGSRATLTLLDGKARENAGLPPVPTWDEGFRPPSEVELPSGVAEDFKERFGQLGYIDLEGSEQVAPELVDPKQFEPDTSSSPTETGGG